jgi:hypothetical protein
LLNLNDDTLLLSIEFQSLGVNTSPSPLGSSTNYSISADYTKEKLPQITEPGKPLFPHLQADSTLQLLLNNANLSDLCFKIEGKPLYAQTCILAAKLPYWDVGAAVTHSIAHTPQFATPNDSPATPKASPLSSHQTTPHRSKPTPTHNLSPSIDADAGSGGSGVTTNFIEVNDMSYDVFYAFMSFIYTGRLPLDLTNHNLCKLHLLCEQYHVPTLQKYCGRELYGSLKPLEACTLLNSYGGKSAVLQEILVFYIVHNFKAISALNGFAWMLTAPKKLNKMRRLLAVLRRLEVPELSCSSKTQEPSHDASSATIDSLLSPSPKLDWRRSMAYRSLLSNPAVADVHFIVEGKTVYAQQSILSVLSDFFLAMFSRTWAENVNEGPAVVEITDFPYTTFYNMLLFLVTVMNIYEGHMSTPNPSGSLFFFIAVCSRN